MICVPLQGYYCFSFCFALGFVCGVCYFITFYRARTARLRMAKMKNNGDKASRQKQKAELKLAMVGVILALMSAVCGIYCLVIALLWDQPEVLLSLAPLGDFLLDVYAWANPYLLIGCSSEVLRHFKAFLKGQRHAVTQVNPSRVATKSRTGRVVNIQPAVK